MTDEVKLCVEILDQAIEFEETGMAFFMERAQNAPSELERNLFKGLAKDEAGHRAHLQRLREDLVRTKDVASLQEAADHDHRSARQIFESALESVQDPYRADNEELEIIKGAMEVERKGYTMYAAAVEKMESKRARDIFRHLAEEEQNHYALLKNTYDFLADPEGWHGFDENPMLDGG